MIENNRLSDDALDAVSGGAGRQVYSDTEMKKAGINVQLQNGQKVYQIKLSNGRMMNLNEGAALSVVDCYKLGGGMRLSDQQLMDLIDQS